MDATKVKQSGDAPELILPVAYSQGFARSFALPVAANDLTPNDSDGHRGLICTVTAVQDQDRDA